MKNLIILGLIALAIGGAHGQGTINPLNGALTRVRVYGYTDEGPHRLARASDNLQIGLFWGPEGGPADNLAGVLTIGPVDGVLVGLPPVFSVPEWGDAGTVISIRFCSIAGLYLNTGTKQVTLAPASGPGTVIWGSTATASRFGPLVANPALPICVPEPSTWVIGGLAGLMLLCRCRRAIPPSPR